MVPTVLSRYFVVFVTYESSVGAGCLTDSTHSVTLIVAVSQMSYGNNGEQIDKVLRAAAEMWLQQTSLPSSVEEAALHPLQACKNEGEIRMTGFSFMRAISPIAA